MIGQLVDGKYQVIRLLGQGGMGAVYEAVHTGTARKVALKLISGGAEKNPEVVSRFQREARAAGQIDTRHIVQVYDTGIDPALGCPFMVMELLAGEDVSELIRRVGALTPDLALRIFAQACVGLQKAHEAQVVHRDIKPANLFLATREGGEVIVKLLDFGIAKMRVDDAAATGGHGLTRTGSMLGSPLYMSPEQAKGLKTVDQRSDLWSLGAVLYEALTGRTPHHHVDTLGQLILAICSEAPPPLQDFAPWVPPEVAAIAHGCMRLEVKDRYQSAAAMLEAATALLPQGHAINASMLAPLPEPHRTYVAPRLVITSAGVPLPPTPSHPPPAAFGVSGAGITGAGSTGPGLTASAMTAGAMTAGATVQTLGTTRPQAKSSTGMMIAAVLSAIVVGGGAAAFFLIPGSGQQATVEQAEPPPAPAPEAPTAAPTESEAVETERTVRVRVSPADATVEVDGRETTVVDGHVEVVGRLGTKHVVVVKSGKRDARVDIAILESGPMPDAVELSAPVAAQGPKAAAAPVAAPAAPPTPAAAPPPAPVSKPKPKPGVPAIDEKFE